MPAVPPPPPVLPPPIEVPFRPVEPPSSAPVATDAPGGFEKIPGGLRITFGNGRADLNPNTLAALKTLAHTATPGSNTVFNVTGYAAGAPDDPSTPRRLSLSRAVAVRGVLMGEGVASTQIYVKALGAALPAQEMPADRVDITSAIGPGVPAPARTTVAPLSATPPAANKAAAP